MVENLALENRECVYTDDTKSKGKGALAWCWLEGDGTEGIARKERVPDTFDFTKIELAAIVRAIDDAVERGLKNLVLFTDCQPAARMIKELENEEEKEDLWDIVVPVLNRLEKCEIVWIKGYQGIRGNEIADGLAKEGVNGGVDWGMWKRWKRVGEGGGLEKDLRKKEWRRWHKEEGHEYYQRKPEKPNQWKGLERLDIYVLMRLRTGVDSTGHHDCDNRYERHHMIKCTKMEEQRPSINTLYNDKKIQDWVKWQRKHEYFG
ncbi:hypothetical protein HOY82DRAFT_537233 [Tuber indicum]|nr:hypothetical protein HOY82DRAFT_537233 [Tuber indicum]